VSEEEVIGFIRTHVGSVYTLELLLLMKRGRHKSWNAAGLVRELRSSGTAVAEALSRMMQAGLVSENPAGRYSFAPASAKHEQLAAEIEKAYTNTPISVVKAITAAPDETLRAFSDASRLEE
jgi:DNA-binding GntR family transcriptional regulator